MRVLSLLFLPVVASAMGSLSGYCTQGGQKVFQNGTPSQTQVMQSYPQCSVTVYYTGGPSGSVTTSGTTVTLESGTYFNASGQWSGLSIVINSVNYTIASVSSSTTILLTTSAGAQNAVTYSMASTTPAPIFTANGSTLANPFTSSLQGFWQFYGITGQYDVRLSGGGIPAPFTWGAESVIDTPALQDTVINVVSYGASPAATDNTAAYTRAMGALPLNGGTILVPNGTFAGSFILPEYPKAIRLLCTGENSTILQSPSANTPLISLSATVPNFSAPKIEVGNCGLQANSAGSTGAMIVLDGMLHPYFHDLTYLSNGSGNYAEMFSQSDANPGFTAAFGADVERITVTNQSGPTNVVTTVNNSSLNQWRNFRIVGNTVMTSVFNFAFASSGGNIVDGLDCEGNHSAVCMIPGRNLVETNGYYEDDAGYITGNGGSNDKFTGDVYSGHNPGTGITGTDLEADWIFENDLWPTQSAPNLTSSGLRNWQIIQGNVTRNNTGGFTTSRVAGLIIFSRTLQPGGGSLSNTSCDGSGHCTYIITAVDQAGNEGVASAQPTVTITSGSNAIVGQANPSNGAAYYNVYGPNCPNVSHTQCGYLHSFDNTFSTEDGIVIDDGSFTPTTQVPPTIDTTGNINVTTNLYTQNGINAVTDTGSGVNVLAGSLNYQFGAIGGTPLPAGFPVLIVATAHAITAGSSVTFNLNANGPVQVNGMQQGAGFGFPCSIAAGSPLELIWNGSSAWIAPSCLANSLLNYVASGDENGSNNAIATVTGYAPLVAGLIVTIQLQHSLQAGANTLAWNGGSAVAIKKHTDPTANIGTGYTSAGVWFGEYNGSVWLDLSQ